MVLFEKIGKIYTWAECLLNFEQRYVLKKGVFTGCCKKNQQMVEI